MHSEAFAYVSKFATHDALDVIEIGSRDVNGTVRPLFPAANWVGLDSFSGPAVDVVGDAAAYVPENVADMVICCEVLEHASNWRELIQVGASWLKPGGKYIITCAGRGRKAHSGIDGRHRLIDNEYYRNLTACEVAAEMHAAGLRDIDAATLGEDTQCVGYKPL